MSQPVMRFVNEKKEKRKNMDNVSHPSFSNMHDFASHFLGGISWFFGALLEPAEAEVGQLPPGSLFKTP